ncbi:hypothetical protein GTW69_35740 [Streptomyces sp. SID7760]|nr:hypothetical protein [Streptomyces sp. SID7760]
MTRPGRPGAEARSRGTQRRGVSFLGVDPPRIHELTTGHADLHWANLTAPTLIVLDWEGWGRMPVRKLRSIHDCRTASRSVGTAASARDAPRRARHQVSGRLGSRSSTGLPATTIGVVMNSVSSARYAYEPCVQSKRFRSRGHGTVRGTAASAKAVPSHSRPPAFSDSVETTQSQLVPTRRRSVRPCHPHTSGPDGVRCEAQAATAKAPHIRVMSSAASGAVNTGAVMVRSLVSRRCAQRT